MEHFKLYEDWNPLAKKNNIYAQLGQNLQNYLNQLQQQLLRNKFFDHKFLKQLTDLSNSVRAKTLNASDVRTLIDDFFKDVLKKLDDAKVDDLKDLHDLYLEYTFFTMFVFRFDPSKLGAFLRNEKWFDFYKVTDVKALRNVNVAMAEMWKKVSVKDKEKSLLSTAINANYKNWANAFSDERVLKLRDLTKYTVKPDAQQTEAENHINEFTSKVSNEDLEKIEKRSGNEAQKIKHLPEITEFKADFLNRFSQPGLPGSYKMMKKWFLESFNVAEGYYGSPLTITSGIRTPEYQKYLTSLGYKTAIKNSPHIEGVAADISIINLDVNRLISAFEKAGFTRFGRGVSFLHVDLGDQLNPKIWVPYSHWTYNY